MAKIAGAGGGGSRYAREPKAVNPKSPKAQLTDPGLSLNPAASIIPAKGQRSDQAKAQRKALTQTPHGGATGLLSEWTGPSLAHLLTTGHVSSKGGLALDALGLFPLGKVARGVRLGADAVKAGRTAEEAAAHIDEVASRARAEGHGGHIGGKGNPPLIEKGVVTEEHGGDLGRQIREGLVRAPGIRTVQNAGYSEERIARVKAATDAGRKAGGGLAGHAAAKRHLADAFPREFFGDWKHMTTADVDHLARVVDKAPLQFFEKTHVIDSIKNAVDNGVVPTVSDQALMERVFGKIAGEPTGKERLAGFWDKFVQATNVPRALRSAGDVSAGFRQLLTVLVTHPKVFARQWVNGVKSFGSEEFYHASQEAIHSDPWFPLLDKWGVPFTEIGSTVKNTEEAFIGAQVAERIHVPLLGSKVAKATNVGAVVRMSDRAFTGMVNGARFEMAKMLAQKAAVLGRDLNDEHLGQSIARLAGTFTGRGVVPKVLESHLTTMNAALFSPRLIASRLNLLSPVYYYKLDPFARREALAGARNLVSAIVTVMFVAKALGADVEFDPRSTNFTKVTVGNHRIDFSGGFSVYIRFIAQEMTREAISSSGNKSHIGWGRNDVSDLANTTKLFRSKTAPIPSLLWDEGSGKDFIGQPVKQGHELFSNAPFVVQDAYSGYGISGPKGAVVDALLSAVGIGVQSYKDKPPKGGGSSGGSVYTNDGGSDGSVYSDPGSGGGSVYAGP